MLPKPFYRRSPMRPCALSCFAAAAAAVLMMSAVTTPAADKKADEHQVVIDNFAFSPRTLTVSVGAKVTWVNRDDVPHTATAKGKPRAFHSGTLDTDGQYSFVFKQPGTYDYFCAVHPHMTGKIIVK